MADEVRKVPDKISEDTENKQEGAVTDEELTDAVCGGSFGCHPIPLKDPPKLPEMPKRKKR